MDVFVEIDGPDVSPGTIDAVVALELASAYFALLRHSAEANGEALRLEGIRVIDKCAAVAVDVRIKDLVKVLVGGASDPSAPDEARIKGQPDPGAPDEATRIVSLLGELDGYARGEPAPGGGEQYAKRLRTARNRLPEGYSAKVIAGPLESPRWERPLETTEPEGLDVDETVDLRVRVIGVGGDQPRARFASDSEPTPFALAVKREIAKELGRHLYDEIDVTAIVRRDPDGQIRKGRLLEFFPLSDEAPGPAWIQWARENVIAWGDEDGESDGNGQRD